MSRTLITFRHEEDGAPVDATSVVLCDPTNAYGVRRDDTQAVVVAANTAMTRIATGIYRHEFTDPADGLSYTYWVKWVYGGETQQLQFAIEGGSDVDPASYLTPVAADELAEDLPGLAAWTAAGSAQKTAALRQASLEIDAAMRYQGRRYTPNQAREFPRTADGTVWDWDDGSGSAIVPLNVRLAALYQADSILAGDREERLDARHDGVAGQSADGLSEQYVGPVPLLCRRAQQLMERYRLRSGEMV